MPREDVVSVRMIKRQPRVVHLMFCEVPSDDDPTVFGAYQPLIGVYVDEADAIAAEFRNPGIGINWIDFDVDDPRGGGSQEFVWVAIATSSPIAPEVDTNPEAVFGSLELGQTWVAQRKRRGEAYRLWRFPLNQIDTEHPTWTEET